MKNIILSLFDYSGSWSKPYHDAGYEVIQVDIKLGIDILEWDYKSIDKSRVYGILAAPPCTDFSISGAVFWKQKDIDGRTERNIPLIKKTLEIINYFNPEFWVIENPIGRLERLVPEIEKYRLMVFNPCDFGDGYSKKTVLYGVFNPLMVRKYVVPINQVGSEHSIDRYMKKIFKAKFNKKTRAELRSITPAGFANAFFEANNNLEVGK